MKKLNVLKGFAVMLLLALSMQVNGQSSFHAGADVVSSYVWRGLLYSPIPNVQPSLTYTSSSGNLSVGTWGSYGIGSYYSEVDFFASYTMGNLTLSFWDYYVMPDMYEHEFFNYKNDETGHAFEVSAVYAGPESFPIQLTWGTFVYGNDKNAEGKNLFSSYFELGYNFSIGETPMFVLAGITPWESFYAPKFSVVNVGLTASRALKITDTFELPLSGGLYFNPQARNAFLVFTMSF